MDPGAHRDEAAREAPAFSIPIPTAYDADAYQKHLRETVGSGAAGAGGDAKKKAIADGDRGLPVTPCIGEFGAPNVWLRTLLRKHSQFLSALLRYQPLILR